MWRIVFVCIHMTLLAEGADWSYSGDHGVDKWCDHFKDCCGKQQSPINIISDNLEEKSFAPFQFDNYEITLKSFNLTNNGHTVKLSFEKSSKNPKILGGGLRDSFGVHSLHFHWGSTDERGSEHQIDGHSYPLEMHIVHLNTKYDLEKAKLKSDGLAVLGVFFQISSSDDKAIGSITNNLYKVVDTNSQVTVTNTNLALSDLLPKDTNVFKRYAGSLTTPTCNEVVTWTVFDSVREISKEQLEQFRRLSGSKEPLSNNYRPPQPLNNRKVFKASVSSSSITMSNICTVSISAVITLAYLYQ